MLMPLSLVLLLTVWALEAKELPQKSNLLPVPLKETESPAESSPPASLDAGVTPRNNLLPSGTSYGDTGKQPDRLPRAASEDSNEPQSTSGLNDHDDDLATPEATQLTSALPSTDGNGTASPGDWGNRSVPERGTTHIHNPLYPLTDGSYGAYGVMFLSLVVFAVGAVGNLAVMCIVWHNYYMRSAWNYILASLAFWDFLVLCFCLPVVVFNELTNKRLLGDISCRVVPYMEVTSLGVTSFSLCALGIDRFHAATSSQPKVQRLERCQTILAKLAVIWVGSMALAAPELLLWQLTQSVSATTGALVDSCAMVPSPSLPESIYSLVLNYHEARTWWYFGCYFCLPVVFTLLCQVATCHVSADAAPQRPTAPAPAKKQKVRHARQGERQLNCTVMALAVVYAVCALPENVCNIALADGRLAVSEGTASLLALINQFFLFFKSSVTPVLLLCLCKSLGQAFMDCCCCCCEECQPGGSAAARADGKAKDANEMSSIFFDKAKDSSTILSISGSS